VSWNVSLFHYRNHGDDFGRVLVGIQIPSSDANEVKLQDFLDNLGYVCTEETEGVQKIHDRRRQQLRLLLPGRDHRAHHLTLENLFLPVWS
jgi:hypothetical protein